MSASRDSGNVAGPRDRTPGTALPGVCVVVPAFNEEAYIARCLESVSRLDYPASLLEVIVVDNGSRDRTVAIAQGCGCRVISHPGVRVGAVRNRGAQESRSEILAFLDADCVAPRDWVQHAVAEFAANPRAAAVGGPYLAPVGASWYEKAWAPRVSESRRLVKHLAGGSLFVRSSLFSSFSGFDATLNAGEDEDFCRRLGRAGHEVVELPACAVQHLGWPRSLREIYLRQRWQGSSQIQSAGRATDRLLLLVHLFTLSAFSLPVLAVWLGPVAAPTVLALVVILGIPALAAFNRKSAVDPTTGWVLRRLQLWLVFGGFFCGRSAGLLLNYWHMATRQDKKVGKKSA